MKKLISIVAAAALSLGATTMSNAAVGIGIGTVRCGAFTNNYAQMGAADQADVRIGVHQWAYGYFTGRNRENPGQTKDVSGLTYNETANFIIAQCRQYPNAYLYEVADVIYEALPYDTAGV